jgi:putative peptidoglycan lipid II flippase
MLFLIFISFFHQTFGAISISIGLFLGSLFSSILSMIILKKIIKFENFKKLNEFKSINDFLYKLPAVAISMLCFSIYQTIDSFWATQLGTSNLSYLGYCQRLLIALGALVITGPSTILIPRLTRSIEEGRNEDFLKDISLILKLVIALSSLVAVIGSIIGKEVITLLFQRGAFEIKDSVNVANILPYMLIGMVFMLCVVMLFRAFFTRNFKNEVVMLGLLSTLFYFIFSGIGSNYLGIKGIAISYIITWVLIFIISIHLIFKENSHYILNYNNFLFLIKHLITLFIVSLVVYSTRFIFNEIKYESIFVNNLIITTIIVIQTIYTI